MAVYRPSPFRARSARAALLMACATVPAAHAQTEPGQDTRLRIEQQLDAARARADSDTRAQAEAIEQTPSSIVIDGERYAVANTVDDVGRALYAALSRRQWADVHRFLAAYVEFGDRDPLLVHYARGGLARQRGQLGEAEREYRRLLALRPDFLPGRLELARVLFEYHKDLEARRLFEAIRADLAGGEGNSVGRSVDLFLSALAQRGGWQGNFAIGPSFSSNLNQSSASYSCLLAGPDGLCLVDRKVPDAIRAAGINVEGVLSRRFVLAGQGGIRARALLFGDLYPGAHAYSQATLIARIGYDHQGARHGIAVSPALETGTLGSTILYRAWGLNGEWTQRLSARALVKLEGNVRRFAYDQREYRAQDGGQADALLTGWYGIPGKWTLLGGGDLVDKGAREAVNAYRQWGVRLGVGKALGEAASLLLLGAMRWREYDAYNPIFEARRSDRDVTLTGVARFPALRFRGLVPELIVQHNRTRSNIDWLYSWRRTTASLRLSRTF